MRVPKVEQHERRDAKLFECKPSSRNGNFEIHIFEKLQNELIRIFLNYFSIITIN